MKFLKSLLLILGLVALGVGGYYFFRSWVDTRSLVAVANANRSTGFASPWPQILMTTLLALGGGLLVGLGLGMPSRLASAIRKDALTARAIEGDLDHRERRVERVERVEDRVEL